MLRGGARPDDAGMLRKASLSFVVAMLSILLSLGAAGARDDEVRREGPCDRGSEWRLIVRRESGATLRVRYVLETGDAGREWSVFLSMNGSRLFAGQRTTNSDGDLRITRYPADRAGDDLIKGWANNLSNGESCSGSLTYRF